MSDKKKFLISYFLMAILIPLLFVKQYIVLILKTQFNPLYISYILSMFPIIKILLEIPTGAMSDYFGCKNSLIIGCMFYLLGYIAILLNKSFASYIIFYLCYGIQSTIFSGSKESYIYNNMKYYDIVDNELARYRSIYKSVYISMLTFASFIGGFLIKKNINVSIVLDIISTLLLICSLLFSSDKANKKIRNLNTNYLKSLKTSLRYTRKHKTLHKYVLYEAIWAAIWDIIISYCVLMFDDISIKYIPSEALLTIKNIILVFVQIIFSKYLYNKDIYFSFKMFLVAAIPAIITNVLFYNSAFNFVGIMVYFSIMQLANYLIELKIQKIIPSKMRSTIISEVGFLAGNVRLIITYIIGYIATISSYKIAFLSVFAIHTILMLVFYIWFNTDTHLKKIQFRM